MGVRTPLQVELSLSEPRMPICQGRASKKVIGELLFTLSQSSNGRDLKPDDMVGTIFLGWHFACFSHYAIWPETFLLEIAIIILDKLVEC